MSKILIVEDDRILRELVKAYLTASEHVVDAVDCGKLAQVRLSQDQYDLIILDWMLPDLPGTEICRNYRNHGGQAPILFLTSRSDKRDKAAGLDSGADDYLVKPFEQIEFQARVRALLRRRNSWQGSVLKLTDLELDTERQLVYRGGKEIKLRPKEFALLELLVRNPGKSFTAETLFRKLWNSDSETSTETVRMHVMALRKKLESDNDPPLIHSSRGLGYRLEVTADAKEKLEINPGGLIRQSKH